MVARLGNIKILEKLVAIHGDTYDLTRITTDKANDIVSIKCKQHDWTNTSLKNLLKGQGGCFACKGQNISKARRMPSIDFIDKLKKAYPTGFKYTNTKYINMTTDIVIECEKHGEFSVTPLNLFREDRRNPCWKCSAGSKGSLSEQSLSAWCATLGEKIVSRTRQVIAPKEIDIWFPDQKLGIEFNGLYWHSEDPKGSLLKYQLAKEQGVRLIQVFEDEWLNKPEIIKDLILAKLGKRVTIYARKTNIKELSPLEANNFYSKWHIAGATKGCRYLGLTYENELVAALTISKSRYTKHNFEIARYAASCNVVGGFDKLFNVIKMENPEASFISYMDLRFGVGNKYERAGFTYIGDTIPDYWWFRQKTKIPRYKTQKHLLQKDIRFKEYYKKELSEREICMAAGYLRVYGVGHQKWEYLQK